MPVERNEYYPKNRNEWRKWLQQFGTAKTHVWLILYKKGTGVPTISYDEVVEEALCFGWIDSKPNKRDTESYYLFIAPRKNKSPWSAANKQRIEKLLKEKRITKAGLEKIEAAKLDGSWTLLDNIEALQMPAGLQMAFSKNKKASGHFNDFPPGVKKQIYQWIENAKTNPTKQKRITETVKLAAQNIRANQWNPKK